MKTMQKTRTKNKKGFPSPLTPSRGGKTPPRCSFCDDIIDENSSTKLCYLCFLIEKTEQVKDVRKRTNSLKRMNQYQVIETAIEWMEENKPRIDVSVLYNYLEEIDNGKLLKERQIAVVKKVISNIKVWDTNLPLCLYNSL